MNSFEYRIVIGRTPVTDWHTSESAARTQAFDRGYPGMGQVEKRERWK